ncbi:MAG TPA: CHASE4 domain-containing protein, partial [Holophaga sp.]|nr:CHASE4 domain-containing protein [Holophaga sp.]
ALFTPGSPLLAGADTEDDRQGVVTLGERPMLLATHPILRSEHAGPARGTMAMGSWLDKPVVASLAANTLLDLRLCPLDAPGVPALSASGDGPSNQDGVLVPPVAESARAMRGFGLVRDISGRPAFWLEITTPRDFFIQGLGLVHSSLLLFALAGAAIIVVSLLLLEKHILRRLRAIAEQSALVARGDAPRRLYLPGSDELSRLAATLNVMLDRLEAAKRSLIASEQRYRSLFLGIGAATILVDKDDYIELANTAFVRLSSLPREDLEGRLRWTEFFPETLVRELRETVWPSAGDHIVQTSFTRRDGETRHVYLTMVLLPTDGGRLLSLIDNTVARQTEQALADLSRKLEETVAERTEEVRTKARELETANKRLKELDQIKSA